MSGRSFRAALRRLGVAALLIALAPAPPLTAQSHRAASTPRKPVRAVKAKPMPVAEPVAEAVLPRTEAADRLIAWVGAARDNASRPFAVIDKPAATLYLFGADGTFLGQAPVLLGVGVGDDSSPGVGAKNLDDIGPAERTTPAGRFVAKFGRAFGRQQVLWVDYANAVALHAVTTTHKNEHRVERLLSPGVDDNRVSFGCINVGTRFYTRNIRPLFEKKGGIVYILPDVKPLDEVFPRVRLLPYLNDTFRDTRQEAPSAR